MKRFIAHLLIFLLTLGLAAPAWAEEVPEVGGEKEVESVVEAYMGVVKDAYEGTYREMDYNFLQDIYIQRQVNGRNHYIAGQQSPFEVESSSFEYRVVEGRIFEKQAKYIVELDISQKLNRDGAVIDFYETDQIGLELHWLQDHWVIFRVLPGGTTDNSIFEAFKAHLKEEDADPDYSLEERREQVVVDFQGMDYLSGIKPEVDLTESKTDAEKAAFEKLLARGFTYEILEKYSHNWVAIEEIFAQGYTQAIRTIGNGMLTTSGYEIAAPSSPPHGSVVEVLWDKEPVIWPDQAPVIVNDRVMVPIRRISEFADGTTLTMRNEDPITFEFTSEDNPGFLARFTMGKATYELRLKEGEPLEEKPLYEPLYVLGDRTMVPLRTIGDVFGAQVDWHADSYWVTIQTVG